MAGGNGVNIGVAAKDQMGPNQLCNGVGEGRQCYNFTAAFRESFNSWHVSRSPAPAAPSRHSARSLLCHDPTWGRRGQDWATNYTQDMLSKTTGGPEIQGPYARMGAANACDFDSIRKMQQDGVRTRENGTLHLTVAEAKAKGGGGSCQPDPSCIAAFLAAAEPFTYMHCSAPPHL